MTIPAGQTSANFTVTIIDDAILEEEELFNFADDSLTLQFTESSYSVSEGAGEVASGTANGTSAVNYTVVVDTMDGSATVLNLSEDIYIVSRCRCETKPKHLYSHYLL